MQCFIEKRDEKHIDDNNSCEATYQNTSKGRSLTLSIHHFTIRNPLAGCTCKNEFEKCVVNKYCTEKVPSKIESTITIEEYIHVPSMITQSTDDGNNNSIYQKIEDSCPYSYCLHGGEVIVSYRIRYIFPYPPVKKWSVFVPLPFFETFE